MLGRLMMESESNSCK